MFANTRSRYDVPRALRAMRALVKDPEDLPQVFTIAESLSGNALFKVCERLGESENGRRLLEQQPDIVDRLSDRDALARAPEGSLARAYLDFVEREGISADGIREASKTGTQGIASGWPQDVRWTRERMRDTHDLWHVVTGYAGDLVGETALLAFTYTQTRNPALAMIAGVGTLKLSGIPGGGRQARQAVLAGLRRGRRAAWLPEQPWETLLDQPLDDVRARLRIAPLSPYREVRADLYRAAA